MSRTNYAGKYKSQAEQPEIVVTGPIEEIVETVKEETKPTIGMVINCKKLNVRSKPSVDSDVVCTVKFCSEVMIDTNKSTPEWFSICTEAGIEGFCMSDYILITE